MALATLLVMTVVLLFLREVRSTFIASLAIPSSVIASFTFFYAFDLSLNTMTLIALSLAIGLVIDDAIVVLESIYRRLEAGDEPMLAAQRGTREVGLAVVSTTLAVCAVFVPIVFMQSTIGRYFYEFGVAVTLPHAGARAARPRRRLPLAARHRDAPPGRHDRGRPGRGGRGLRRRFHPPLRPLHE